MIGKVEADRQRNIAAFGIVDRDALMKNKQWDTFWETDDNKYKNAKPFGDHVTQLCRWELENYLLDPEELENMLADVGKDAPRKKRPIEFMLKELAGHCNTLIPVMAINVLLHHHQKESLAMGFGSDCFVRKDMETRIEIKINKDFPETLDETKMRHTEYIRQIEAFAENHTADSEEYWNRLNRVIDGKRIFHRLSHQNRLRTDYRFHLARRIREKKKIDKELTDLVNSFKDA